MRPLYIKAGFHIPSAGIATATGGAGRIVDGEVARGQRRKAIDLRENVGIAGDGIGPVGIDDRNRLAATIKLLGVQAGHAVGLIDLRRVIAARRKIRWRAVDVRSVAAAGIDSVGGSGLEIFRLGSFETERVEILDRRSHPGALGNGAQGKRFVGRRIDRTNRVRSVVEVGEALHGRNQVACCARDDRLGACRAMLLPVDCHAIDLNAGGALNVADRSLHRHIVI